MKSVIILLALLLAACSTPDNTEPPAELTAIPDPLRVAELWSLDTGEGGVRNVLDLQPLVLDDKLYTIDTRGVIHQVDFDRGDSDWRFRSGLKSFTGLTAHQGSLLVTSREGLLARFDLQDNSLKQRWQHAMLSEIRSRPVAVDDQVILRTVDGRLTSLDFATGNIQWTVSRRVPALSLTGNSHPIVAGDLVISGFDNGKLVAFERDSGNTVWETTVGSPSGRTEIERLVDLDGQFVLRDGVVYVSSFQGNLAAITANSGQVIWSRKFSSFQAVEADDDALYLTDDRSHVWAIDRRTGSAFWKQEALSARKLTAPRLVDDHLLVGDLEGYVHYLHTQDGRLLARSRPSEQRYISQPVVIGTTAILLDETGQLTALLLNP